MDTKRFQHIVIALQPKLLRVAFVLLKDLELAKDVVQEVSLKLWEMRDGLSLYDNLEAFSVRMTKNLCINQLKSKHQQTMKMVSILPEGQHDKTPFRATVAKNDLEQVIQLMEGLTLQQRLIFQLRHFEGQSFQEIAEATGLTINNIQVSLSRTRKRLKARFKTIQDYGTT